MKRVIISLVFIPLFALAAGTVSAHSGHERFDNRLERQQARIKQGIHSGELTRKEARYLKKEQKRLRKYVRKFGRDGKYSKRERRKIMNQMDRASENIRDFKHNRSSRSRAKSKYHRKHREYWRDADNHRWSYELSWWPKYSYR